MAYQFLSKKHVKIAAIMLLMIALSLSACSGAKHSKDPDKTDYKQHDEVFFSLVDDTLTSTGASFLTENTGDDIVFYGPAEYTIQIWKNGSWYSLQPIHDDYEVKAYGIELAPKSEFVNQIDWSFLYGDLRTGDYRILIEYAVKSSTNNRVIDQNCFMICAFSIP